MKTKFEKEIKCQNLELIEVCSVFPPIRTHIYYCDAKHERTDEEQCLKCKKEAEALDIYI